MQKSKFQIDTRLVTLLSQSYSSSEQALKELIDNAWDADADTVFVEIPDEAMTNRPIIIKDTGSGMTELELRNEYLVIASNRRNRRGDLSHLYKRKVKGKKRDWEICWLNDCRLYEIRNMSKFTIFIFRNFKH